MLLILKKAELIKELQWKLQVEGCVMVDDWTMAQKYEWERDLTPLQLKWKHFLAQ